MTAPTIWDEGTEPARRVVLLGVALTLTAAAADLLVGHDLGWIFDVGFVLLCPTLALRIHPRDFFPVSVTPPLLMLGLFVVIAAMEPAVLAERGDGVLQGTLSGLAHHSWALFLGYAACLACLQVRRRRIASGRYRPRLQSGSAGRRRRERRQAGGSERRSAEGGPEARRGATTPPTCLDGVAQQARDPRIRT